MHEDTSLNTLTALSISKILHKLQYMKSRITLECARVLNKFQQSALQGTSKLIILEHVWNYPFELKKNVLPRPRKNSTNVHKTI